MDPLTTALLTAIAAAAGALASGVGEAAAGDAWAATKAKLAGWMRLEERGQQRAFAEALQAAVAELRRISAHPQQTERALQLLTQNSPEGRSFVELVTSEFLFSLQPNIGRLLDAYRHGIGFTSLLGGEQPLLWDDVEPVLILLLQFLLPSELVKQPALRTLILERAELQALDSAQAQLRAIEALASGQRRIESLLEECLRLPRLAPTISAGDGASITDSPLTVVLGGQHTYTIPPTREPDLQLLYRRYREFLIKRFATLDFRGIAQMQNVLRLPLSEVYVPLRGIAPDRERRGWLVFDQASWSKSHVNLSFRRAMDNELAQIERGSALGEFPLHDLIRNTARLVILGDPGAGKSTVVRAVLLALIEGHGYERLGLDGTWLPIFFPVAAFADARSAPGRRDLAPLEYLREFFAGHSQPDYLPLFERALLSGQALVLIDGLDEVRDDRRTVADCLESFVREWDPLGNRFVITSRIAGYADAPLDATLFKRTMTLPLNDDEIRRFTRQWSIAFESTGTLESGRAELERIASLRATDLNWAIFASWHSTELARNPLLLTILALIHNQGARLPDRRVELYRLCVECLAETWNRARSLSGRELNAYLDNDRLDERFVVNILGPTALQIHQESPGGLVAQEELIQIIADTLTATDELPAGKARRVAGEFIELVQRETGLLQERGYRTYSFLHLTFEEYLAARALRESVTVDTEARLHEYATIANWREVIRLCIASAPQKDAQRLLLHLLQAPISAETRGRPAILAGECLLDLGGRSDKTPIMRSSVIMALLGLLRDPQVLIPTRVEAGHVLGRLGDPRLLDWRTGEAAGYKDDDQVEPYWCPIEAGPFWFGDERLKDNKGKTQLRKDKIPMFDPGKLQRAELPDPFSIARYPVTNAEFAAFLAANGPDGYDPAKPWWTAEGRTFLVPDGHPWDDQKEFVRWPRYWDDSQLNSPSQPVVGVSWYEAAAYCRWLTGVGHERGWLPHDREIRLPTSLEWERTARHTDRRPFPWGDAPPTPQHANYSDTGVGAPTPVGCFPAGQAICGAEDLMGNTREWMSSAYQDHQQVEAIHPQKDFASDGVVLLSSAWHGDGVDRLCCGVRSGSDPFNWNIIRSFRVVQSFRDRFKASE